MNMTKADIIDAALEMKTILFHENRSIEGEDANKLQELDERFGHIPPIRKIKEDAYDARMTHSGFGSPDCTCHINPPCFACVAWCRTCKEYTNNECPESHY